MIDCALFCFPGSGYPLRRAMRATGGSTALEAVAAAHWCVCGFGASGAVAEFASGAAFVDGFPFQGFHRGSPVCARAGSSGSSGPSVSLDVTGLTDTTLGGWQSKKGPRCAARRGGLVVVGQDLALISASTIWRSLGSGFLRSLSRCCAARSSCSSRFLVLSALRSFRTSLLSIAIGVFLLWFVDEAEEFRFCAVLRVVEEL